MGGGGASGIEGVGGRGFGLFVPERGTGSGLCLGGGGRSERALAGGVSLVEGRSGG